MTENRPRMAICYDFDKTLSPDDMQTFTLIPSFGIDKDKFWAETDAFARENSMESNLSWMFMLVRYSRFLGKSLKREYFRAIGAQVELYRGVTDWFARTTAYAAQRGIELEHYIISSGLKEIIEGSAIAICLLFIRVLLYIIVIGSDEHPAIVCIILVYPIEEIIVTFVGYVV